MSKCGKYIRYGFHIYFNRITADREIKVWIANELKKNPLPCFKHFKERYPASEDNELLDTSPMIGTTSIPLSFPPN